MRSVEEVNDESIVCTVWWQRPRWSDKFCLWVVQGDELIDALPDRRHLPIHGRIQDLLVGDDHELQACDRQLGHH